MTKKCDDGNCGESSSDSDSNSESEIEGSKSFAQATIDKDFDSTNKDHHLFQNSKKGFKYC